MNDKFTCIISYWNSKRLPRKQQIIWHDYFIAASLIASLCIRGSRSIESSAKYKTQKHATPLLLAFSAVSTSRELIIAVVGDVGPVTGPVSSSGYRQHYDIHSVRSSTCVRAMWGPLTRQVPPPPPLCLISLIRTGRTPAAIAGEPVSDQVVSGHFGDDEPLVLGAICRSLSCIDDAHTHRDSGLQSRGSRRY